MVWFMARRVSYAMSTGAVLGHPWLGWQGWPGWALWGWWGLSEAAGPSARFSPLEAADDRSIFPSLALTEAAGS